MRILVLLLVAAPVLAAPQQPIALDIAAGRVGEVCMPLEAGQTLSWRFRASRPVDFNLHQHVEGKVLMPVERKAVNRQRGQHRVAQGNEWCLMWTAPAAQGATVQGHWQALPRAAR